MSFSDCFARTTATCTEDQRCELQYDSSTQNATCVPVLGNVPLLTDGMSLEDLTTLQNVLWRLLPDENRLQPGDSISRQQTRDALALMIEELRPRIRYAVRNALRTNNFQTWRQLIVDVAETVLDETGEDCSICQEALNTGIRLFNSTCSGEHVFHDACAQEWFRLGNITCPTCRGVTRTEAADPQGDAAANPEGGAAANPDDIHPGNLLILIIVCASLAQCAMIHILHAFYDNVTAALESRRQFR